LKPSSNGSSSVASRPKMLQKLKTYRRKKKIGRVSWLPVFGLERPKNYLYEKHVFSA
jgi:hypothetical protein